MFCIWLVYVFVSSDTHRKTDDKTKTSAQVVMRLFQTGEMAYDEYI